MKKLIYLFLALLIPLTFFGQNTSTSISITSEEESVSNSVLKSMGSKAIDRNQEMRDRQAIYYLGDGVYEVIRVGGGSGRKNKEEYMMEDLNTVVNQLVIQKGAKSFKIIFKDFNKMIIMQQPALLNVKVQLLDNDGNPKLDKNEAKDNAKKQLVELKEFLDLGIITQDEFDKKAGSLKKILLGN